MSGYSNKSFQQICVEADPSFYSESNNPVAYVFGNRVFRTFGNPYQQEVEQSTATSTNTATNTGSTLTSSFKL